MRYTFWSENRLPSEQNLQNQPSPPTEEPELTGKLLGMEIQPLHRSADQSDPHGPPLSADGEGLHGDGPTNKARRPINRRAERSKHHSTPEVEMLQQRD